MQFLFAGELASAVFGNRMGKVVFNCAGLVGRMRPPAARLERWTSRRISAFAGGLIRFDDISRAGLIHFVEFGFCAGVWCSRAQWMTVGDILQAASRLCGSLRKPTRISRRGRCAWMNRWCWPAEQRRRSEAASAKVCPEL